MLKTVQAFLFSVARLGFPRVPVRFELFFARERDREEATSGAERIPEPFQGVRFELDFGRVEWTPFDVHDLGIDSA